MNKTNRKIIETSYENFPLITEKVQSKNIEFKIFLENRMESIQESLPIEESPRYHYGVIYTGNKDLSDTNIQVENLIEMSINSNSPLTDMIYTITCNLGIEADPEAVLKDIKTTILDPHYIDDNESINDYTRITEEQKVKVVHFIATELSKVLETLELITNNFGSRESIIIMSPLSLEVADEIKNFILASKLNPSNILYIPELTYDEGILGEYEASVLNKNLINITDEEDNAPYIYSKIIGEFGFDYMFYHRLDYDLYKTFGNFTVLISPINTKTKIMNIDAAISLYNISQLKKFYDASFEYEVSNLLLGDRRNEFIFREFQLRNGGYTKHLENIQNPSSVFNISGSIRSLDRLKLNNHSITKEMYNNVTNLNGGKAINTIKSLIQNARLNNPEKEFNILVMGETDSRNTNFRTKAGYYNYVLGALDIVSKSSVEGKINIEIFDHRTKDCNIYQFENLEDTIFTNYLKNFDMVLIGSNHYLEFVAPLKCEEIVNQITLSYKELAKEASNLLYYKEDIVIPVLSLDSNVLFLPKIKKGN